jgi:hypothetical protein
MTSNDADGLRKPYGDSLAGDTLGIAIRRKGDTFRLSFQVSVIPQLNRDRQAAVLFMA